MPAAAIARPDPDYRASSLPYETFYDLTELGEPGLVSMLKQEAPRPLNAQVAVRSALGPLLSDEVGGYVMHRLGVVGNGSPSSSVRRHWHASTNRRAVSRASSTCCAIGRCRAVMRPPPASSTSRT
jgi:hypothetical protein